MNISLLSVGKHLGVCIILLLLPNSVDLDKARNIVPQESTQKVGKQFPITLAPYSITVLVLE